ncbi:MAG: type II 3-dehydroquinate dehydratase [Rickettsiales bacterium]|nr:type II 3-dehydroquinate dehydratase [Rickettsiales bacterium]
MNSHKKTILILNGPNLNMLGIREPETYGSNSLTQLEELLVEKGQLWGLEVQCKQSNFEGELVTWVQEAYNVCDGIILNAGAYTHTSVAIRDALLSVAVPFIEVHISNVHKRESFRHHSYLSDVAQAVICGMGVQGYVAALEYFKVRDG